MNDTVKLAEDLINWFDDPSHYSVIHFASEAQISKKHLFKLGNDCKILGEALDYAFTVQEYKITEGALSGQLDKTTALRMLETYNGWKNKIDIDNTHNFSKIPTIKKDGKEVIYDVGSEVRTT